MQKLYVFISIPFFSVQLRAQTSGSISGFILGEYNLKPGEKMFSHVWLFKAVNFPAFQPNEETAFSSNWFKSINNCHSKKLTMQKILLLVLSTLFVFSSFAQTTGSINGRIVDTDGEPVPSITVSLGGISNHTMTNDNGEFSMRNIPSGVYTLEATGIGFTAAKQNVQIIVQRCRKNMPKWRPNTNSW